MIGFIKLFFYTLFLNIHESVNDSINQIYILLFKNIYKVIFFLFTYILVDLNNIRCIITTYNNIQGKFTNP